MWLFVAASGGSLKGIAGNISVIIFSGVIAVVTFLDWQGLITVRGLANWSVYQGGKRRAFISLFVIGFAAVLGAYLVQALVETWRGARRDAQPLRTFVLLATVQRLQGQVRGQVSFASARFQKSFGGWKPQSKIAFGIGVGCSGILATCLVCSSFTIALGAALPSAPTQTASSRIIATATIPKQSAVRGNATATLVVTPTATASPIPSPTPSPTATPTPVPTKPPTPTNPPCANPCNPWGYNFSRGNRIYSPPGNFCDYFDCISNFWNGRGYVMQCKDGRFAKSGGISGSCSRHGGNWRPLYSH
jgi:hypothetical protein